MHADLIDQLETHESILSVTGEFKTYEFLRAGSDCKYGGSCSESLWTFKVNGEKQCINVDVVLHESFPIYYVVSVEPAVYWETTYQNGTLVSEKEKRIQGCT